MNKQNNIHSFLLFWVEGKRYAMRVNQIKRIIRATEIISVPESKNIVAGLVNVAGTIIPVIDMRTYFGSLSKEIQLSDRFILINKDDKDLVLWVDQVDGVIEILDSSIEDKLDENLCSIKAVSIEGEIVLIQNMDEFFVKLKTKAPEI